MGEEIKTEKIEKEIKSPVKYNGGIKRRNGRRNKITD